MKLFFASIALLAGSVFAQPALNLVPLPMKVERTGERIVPRAAKIDIVTDDTLGDEAYVLETTGGNVTIRSKTKAGSFYAMQTLAQLGGDTIPQVRITDQPRFAYRGMLLDSARHMQSIDYLKRTIDRLASYKINRLHWHLTDDGGWRVEIKKYPKLTEIGAWRGEGAQRYGGFYTQAQLRDLVAYAAERNVTIIPEIEMPGHAQALVASYPQAGCVGAKPSVMTKFQFSQFPLCPSNPQTYEIVQEILDEVMDMFPSQAIHIGGDECPREPWKACPRCQAFMKERKLANEDALQAHFEERIAAHLRSKSRRAQGWSEIVKWGEPGKDVIVHQWNDAAIGAAAAMSGHDVVVSQHEFLYFDYPLTRTPLQKTYEFDPMPAALSPEAARHIRGPQACLWTENFPTEQQMDVQTWPRMLAVAEMGWSPQSSRKWEDFERRMKAVKQ